MSSSKWLRLAVTLWAVGLLVVSVRIVMKPRSHSVYPIFVEAGRDWLAGNDLYEHPHHGIDQFRYSPLVAASFAPLSLLSDRVGNLLWRWLNAAVLLGAMAWWVRTCLRRLNGGAGEAWSTDAVGLVFALTMPMALGSLNNGQSNALIAGLMLAAVAGCRGGYWNLASMAIAVACLFKVYPIAVGLLLAVVYPRRLPWRLAVALALGAALPFLLQRPEYVAHQYGAWFRHMTGDDRQTWPLEATYRDLRLLFRLCLTPLSANAYRLIQLVAAAIIALICAVKSGNLLQGRREEQRPANGDMQECDALLFLFALASCWMTVLGSATESCTYILLGPALAVVVVQAWLEGRPRWERTILAVSYGLLLIAQLSSWFPFGTQFHSYGPQPAGGLLFFIYLLVRLLAVRRPRERLLSAWPAALPRQAP
jgi:hypothetical protein